MGGFVITILLRNGTVLDSKKIECSDYAKMFIEYAFELASFDGDIDMVGMRFSHAVQGIVSGVVLGKMLPEVFWKKRAEILRSLPEALKAFEQTYPDVRLRFSWAKWLEYSRAMHQAHIPSEEEFSSNARVAAAWWDSRLIRPSARVMICPLDLESELERISDYREEIDKVYADLSDGIARNVTESIERGKPAIVHSAVDWMAELSREATNKLEELGEGAAPILYLTEEIMKVTPTRVLVTGKDCEWIEVYPGNMLDEVVNRENIYKACARHAYGRFVDHLEFLGDD